MLHKMVKLFKTLLGKLYKKQTINSSDYKEEDDTWRQ
jgi:hypothetical protein